ncbi:hypothetical protein B0T13DRAFT_444501 [Neurospora crassa]|nr:hypothetical protein B0T13DRAFT_444501 [Neurospora crassa]
MTPMLLLVHPVMVTSLSRCLGRLYPFVHMVVCSVLGSMEGKKRCQGTKGKRRTKNQGPNQQNEMKRFLVCSYSKKRKTPGPFTSVITHQKVKQGQDIRRPGPNSNRTPVQSNPVTGPEMPPPPGSAGVGRA